MTITVYLFLFIATFSSCEICLDDNLNSILFHIPNDSQGSNIQPHKFCISCISAWKNKCLGALECLKCRYKMTPDEQTSVELTIAQRRYTILVEKRRIALKNEMIRTIKKVAYIRLRNKIMQKFIERVIDNSAESKQNAFRSWRKLWKIHRDTYCSKCTIKFDTYFWQLHAKGYFEYHELHQGRLCKDCIKHLPLNEGRQKCYLCQEKIVPIRKTNTSIFYPLVTLLVYEYSYHGDLLATSVLSTWINRYFSNFAIIVSGHYFSKSVVAMDFGAFCVSSLTFSNYIEVTTHCSFAGLLPISWVICYCMGHHPLFFPGNPSDLVEVIIYPLLADFISHIYNPKQLAPAPYVPVLMSNLLIVLGGNQLLADFIGRFDTYEFGYIGRLIDKSMRNHLHLRVFVIELTMLLNIYDSSTFLFISGCLLLFYTFINKLIK